MRRLLLMIAISAAALVGSIPRGRALATQRSGLGSAPSAKDAPPTDVELRAFIDRVVANQHADDAALPLYQRMEQRQVRDHASDATPSEDKTFRVIPIGTGSGWRVLVEDHGHPVSAADYQAQIVNVERALELITDPTNEKSKRDLEKYRHHLKDRADLINAAREGYLFTWAGRESRDGRTLIKIRMDPNPNFKPTSRETEVFSHTVVTIWVDESSAHVARIEAQLNSDIGVGGGVIGKAYRGSHLTIEQSEVAPGVWLPSRLQYDLTIRKFLFSSEIHEHIEDSQYVRIGAPSEALAFIRRELTPAVGPRAQQ
ncbi:MAG TPA: hypothetical protein VLV89_09130 [Candidatus Acidoferrum sp.]|nr:hypothetical protein [Candidatus Acidoferrum sp.]